MIQKHTIRYHKIDVAVKITGKGEKTIVFIHGGSMSSAIWFPQLINEELLKRYRLIAIDLPGHGDSGWHHDAGSYGLKELADVVKLVISAFPSDKFILTGLSYGTNVIGEITPPLDNCTGIMLVSPCILNDQFPPGDIITPGPLGHIIVADNPSDSDLRAYIDYGTKDSSLAEMYFNSYRQTDPAFRQALGNMMMTSGWTDELDNIRNWDVPVCVLFGEEEKLINTNYLNDYPALWYGKVCRIEKAGHVINWENSQAFNQLLIDFAATVFK